MAIPGETECREVASCGEGRWGAAPVTADTQYVDGSYVGGDGDGSAERPWRSIQDGIDAAAAGCIVAIAAGSYAEDLDIVGKAVRLWGRCPSQVEIVGIGGFSAVFIRQGATGTELRDLAIRGPTRGVTLSGSTEVLLHRVWLHHTGERGVDGDDVWGQTAVALHGSLVEHTTGVAVAGFGTEVRIEQSVLRDTQPDQAGDGGKAMELAGQEHPATLRVARSLIERHHMSAVQTGGADGEIVDSVIRQIVPRPLDGDYGYALSIQDSISGRPSQLLVRSSVLADSTTTAILLAASALILDRSVVRDTAPLPMDGTFGRGIGVQSYGSESRASATIRDSLFLRNHDVAVFIGGGEVRIESTRIAETQPETTRQGFGRGVVVRDDPHDDSTAQLTMRDCIVEDNHDVALSIIRSEALVERCLLRHTWPRLADGSFGDGISVLASGGPAMVDVRHNRIEHSARAGVGSFGARVSVLGTTFECNLFALNGEAFEGVEASFVDAGGNLCGCGDTTGPCTVVSSNLEPPEPVSAM